MKLPLVKLWKHLNLERVNTYCPVCQSENIEFNPLPDFYRKSSENYGYPYLDQGEMTALDTYSCGQCGASDRERLYAYWITEAFAHADNAYTSKVVHFAPEKALSTFLMRTRIFGEYQTADLLMPGVDHKADLMCLPFSDESYDFFICSHVLEHVADDYAAIRELFRVTKRKGRGILMVPIVIGLPSTIEDPSITDEATRWRLFGQHDHVRLYSHGDYVKRIKACGFDLQQLDELYFGRRLFHKLGLKSTSVLYVVSKP